MLLFPDGSVTELKLISDRKYVPVKVRRDGKRLWMNFPYNRNLLDEIKQMEGSKWHGYEEPPIKQWTIADSVRNRFQLSFLAGMNPYKAYDKDHKEQILPKLRLVPYEHQFESVQFIVARKQCILAEEMGLGKSLAAILSMELSGTHDWWWVAPKAGLNAVRLELDKWSSKVRPELFTYDGVKKALKNWTDGEPPPQNIVFDECQKLKNPTSQRTQASRYLADAMREYWGDNCHVILMSGTPAPKSPADWWSLCEVACPGFLKEGTLQKFVARLAILKQEDSLAGGKFNRILGWKDNPRRCVECGKMDTDHFIEEHVFVGCENEVSKLYDRMRGLVLVKFKKDCLDLPDKHYRLIKLRPTIGTANAAKLISNSGANAVTRLIRLRELSDGFQYTDVVDGKETCQTCKGYKYTGTEGTDACPMCSGTGEQVCIVRRATQIETPKDEALLDVLEEFEDVGRLVCYAAFTESIDRVVKLATASGWAVIRVDGRGWKMFAPTNDVLTVIPYTDQLLMLKDFQAPVDKNFDSKFDNILFVGHPGSAGVGLTLTASPAILYWSNDFLAENRIQSEDRIHRPGMDLNKGATIIDFIYLPSDKLVLDNLKKKRDLQNITMGELDSVINDFS